MDKIQDKNFYESKINSLIERREFINTDLIVKQADLYSVINQFKEVEFDIHFTNEANQTQIILVHPKYKNFYFKIQIEIKNKELAINPTCKFNIYNQKYFNILLTKSNLINKHLTFLNNHKEKLSDLVFQLRQYKKDLVYIKRELYKNEKYLKLSEQRHKINKILNVLPVAPFSSDKEIESFFKQQYKKNNEIESKFSQNLYVNNKDKEIIGYNDLLNENYEEEISDANINFISYRFDENNIVFKQENIRIHNFKNHKKRTYIYLGKRVDFDTVRRILCTSFTFKGNVIKELVDLNKKLRFNNIININDFYNMLSPNFIQNNVKDF